MRILILFTALSTLCLVMLLIQLHINKKRTNLSKTYDRLQSMPVLGRYINLLGIRLYIDTDYDENKVKRKVIQIFANLIMLNLFLIIACLFLYDFTFYMVIISVFICTLISNIALSKMLGDINGKVLFQLPDLLVEIKNNYYEKNMIDDALYDASMNVEYEVSLKAKEMHKILTRPNLKLEVEKYNRECKNKFLKILMSVFYITKEYGDKKIGEKSIFVQNLNYVLEEVNIEIHKQNLIKQRLKGLVFAAIFPIFFIHFIEYWSIANFPKLNEFYTSNIGFIIKNVVVILTVIVASIIIKIQNFGEKASKSMNIKSESTIYDRALKNRMFKKTIHFLKPKKDSKEYHRIIRLMESSKTKYTIEIIYLIKLVSAVLATFLTATMLINSNQYLDDIHPWIIVFEMVIAVLIGILFYRVPNYSMKIDVKMRDLELYDEVCRFNTIILLLMHYERTSSELILTWMERFSESFINPIKRCINNFENGGEMALVRLKSETSYKPFKRIINNLILSERSINVKKAFNFLETEREFYKEERKKRNEESVMEKANLAAMIGYIPYYVLLGLYFVLPILYTSMKELSGLLEQIKKF